MPKAVKDHRTKKDSQMHEAFIKRKRNANATNTQHQWFQKEWRVSCLRQRLVDNKITEKNKKEISSLLGASSSDPLRMATA